MKISKKKLKKHVLDVFRKNPEKQMNYKQVSAVLGIDSRSKRRLVMSVLDELYRKGELIEVKKGKYQYHRVKKYVEGVLELTNRGEGSVYCKELDEYVFIPSQYLNHALPGDKVKVLIFAKRKKSKLIGEVVEILKRSRQNIVGTVSITKNIAFLITEHKKFPYDVFIPLNKLKGAKNGYKAVVKIIEWPEYAKNPVGEVVEVLGKSGTHEAEMHAILLEFDLPYRFPEKVLKAAEQITAGITPEEIKKRKDFRDVLTFTIDPADAKDFDDAISFRDLGNGKYEIGVHIADVTHYVKEGTIIDKEAEKRGTSVYLVDRVVPMLPEKLSNDICSLNPHTEKLTFSVVFTLNQDAKLLKHWIGKTVIKSDRRFNYDEVQKILETGEGDFAEELKIINSIARKFRKKRVEHGAVLFDRGELRFKVDKKGVPTEVIYKEPREAEQLIEEFMLLANRKVAEKVGKTKPDEKPKTFVYRVHDEPDYEKLRSFKDFIEKFGFKINMKSPKTIAKSLNYIFEQLKDKPERDVIANYAVRSMAKAVYSTNNIGHYGLGFDYYTHFTSPIRRYPDMMVHRLLERYLNKGKSVNKEYYEDRCKHASEREQLAMNAEWASIKYKAVEFMKDKVGEEYDGLISGITEWGMFVEIIKYKIEGVVLLRNIEDDFFYFDERQYALIGHYTNKVYKIGNKVRVKVAKADLVKRQLDLQLI